MEIKKYMAQKWREGNAGYAQTRPTEYIAEAFRQYFVNNSLLKSVVPNTYEYCKQLINDFTKEQIEIVEKSLYVKLWNANRNNKFAKGTTHAPKGVAEVFEEGLEIITTKKGTFVPFEGGEGVIPAEQTKTLMNLANAFNKGSLQIQMPNMGYQVPTSMNTNVNNNNIHFDALINIDGNADSTTVERMKDIAQGLINNRQFGEQMTKIVSKRQASDGRMAGKRFNVI